MLITKIAANLAAMKPMSPVTIHVGDMRVRIPEHVHLKDTDVMKVNIADVEKHGVEISMTVCVYNPTRWILRGEWNAIEGFLKEVLPNEYTRLMDDMQFNANVRDA